MSELRASWRVLLRQRNCIHIFSLAYNISGNRNEPPSSVFTKHEATHDRTVCLSFICNLHRRSEFVFFSFIFFPHANRSQKLELHSHQSSESKVSALDFYDGSFIFFLSTYPSRGFTRIVLAGINSSKNYITLY